MAMDHDHRCDQQEADLKQVVDRTQQLVNEKHAHDLAIQQIQSDLHLLCLRVPVSVAVDLSTLRLQMDDAIGDIESIREALKSSFAPREDFVMLRTQWYYLIGLICTGFVAGLVAFVVNGGLKP